MFQLWHLSEDIACKITSNMTKYHDSVCCYFRYRLIILDKFIENVGVFVFKIHCESFPLYYNPRAK